jgi:Amidohydrolase family
MDAGRPLPLEEVPNLAYVCASCGIYFVEDMGHRSGLGLTAKRALAGISEFPAGFRTAGRALYKKGTYGDFLGRGVSGKMEIKEAIRELVETGADFIKIINSGIVSLEAEEEVTPGGFSVEEWKVISGEAKSRHLRIRCHANSDKAIRSALSGGADSIEHGFFVTRDTLHWMAESQIAWVPTVSALSVLREFFEPGAAKRLEKTIAGHLEALHYGVARGVKIVLGTDSGSRGVSPGLSFFSELQWFQQAGLSTEQILDAACQEKEQIEEGNYLLVEKDFIKKARVEGVYYRNKPLKKSAEEVN